MEQIEHFRIVSKIGEGGMGAVYRAYDEQLQRDVAVKLLPDNQFADPIARARLLREARAAAALTHPNICVVHEVGESDGHAYIAMECIEGESLDQRISRGPMQYQEIIRFGIQLADALAHAHQRGIVHRDLKPTNIIITRERRLKVLDFGLARRLESVSTESATEVQVTKAGMMAGTPAYMSPEQLSGLPADVRSDIWAVGTILYEMASARRPFAGNTLPALSAAILTSAPAALPEDVPSPLSAVIHRCLEKNPADRYQSAAEVCSALEVLQSGIQSGMLRSLPVPREKTRMPLLAAVAVLVTLVAAGAALYVSHRTAAPGMRPTPAAVTQPAAVAVLPFSSFSGAEEEYLADGIQDAVIAQLGRAPGLRVISRTSTLAFKKSAKTATEIAKALNAENLVEGSVTHAGDRIRIEVKLIRTKPQEQEVWSDAYDRDMRDVLSLYSQIASAVASQIDVRLAGNAVPLRQSTRNVNPEVYQLYLKGRFQLKKETDEGFREGIALLRQANEKDPSDPLPYAGIAIAYALSAHAPSGTPEVLQIAQGAARKALQIDPDQAEAHAAIAFLKQYAEWNPNGLEQEWRRALELSPADSEVRRHYAWFLMSQKRVAEALTEMKRARDDDPLSGIYASDYGWLLQIAGHYDEALLQARRGVELTPDDNDLLVLGLVYDKKRMFDEAVEAHRKLASVNPSMNWALAYTLVLAGRDAEAGPMIKELKQRQKPGAALGLAAIYAAKGDKDESLRWLGVMRARHHVWVPWIGVFAEFAPLRGDPRFEKLLGSIGVPNVEPGFGQPQS